MSVCRSAIKNSDFYWFQTVCYFQSIPNEEKLNKKQLLHFRDYFQILVSFVLSENDRKKKKKKKRNRIM